MPVVVKCLPVEPVSFDSVLLYLSKLSEMGNIAFLSLSLLYSPVRLLHVDQSLKHGRNIVAIVTKTF